MSRRPFSAGLFHLVCKKNATRSPRYDEDYFQKGFPEAEKFFGRFGGHADFTDRDVLDFGCGYGSTCIYLARHGARSVTGIDIDERRVGFGREKLRTDYADLADKVSLSLPDEVGDAKFDMVISKNCFEHYDDPERITELMKGYLRPDGRLVIGFSPLWKAPYGGHISFMTLFPWAHLVFPEAVIMEERKRFRPDEDARQFSEIRGGLNKMTYARLVDIMERSGLRFEQLGTNVSTHPVLQLFNVLRRLPGCREYFTQNIYCVLRLANGGGA